MFASLTGCTILGAIVGAAIPIAYGIWLTHDFAAYVAAQPPGVALSGTPALRAWATILIGGPLGGTIGAVTGLIGGAVCGLYLRSMKPVRPDGRPYKPD